MSSRSSHAANTDKGGCKRDATATAETALLDDESMLMCQVFTMSFLTTQARQYRKGQVQVKEYNLLYHGGDECTCSCCYTH